MTTKKAISELRKLIPPNTPFLIKTEVKQAANFNGDDIPECQIEVFVDSMPCGLHISEGNCLTPCVHDMSLWLIKHYWPQKWAEHKQRMHGENYNNPNPDFNIK